MIFRQVCCIVLLVILFVIGSVIGQVPSSTTAGNMLLSGTTTSLGGGALLAGGCTSNTVTVNGAQSGMAVLVTPTTYPGTGVLWHGYVSSANTVTVEVCVILALTPTGSTYNVRVIQ